MSTYIDAYERIVKAIGHGFHPDTPGIKYLSLPDGITPRDVDQAVADVIDNGNDPYVLAASIMNGGPSATVGAPVSVTLRDGSSVEIEVDLSEFLDGALEALEDGADYFNEGDARAIDEALQPMLKRGRLTVTLFPRGQGL